MAKVIPVKIIQPSDLGKTIVKDTTGKFNVDFSSLELPNGIDDIKLDGSNLIITGSKESKSVDLSKLLPNITAEIFLKKVEKSGKNLKFTVGEKDSDTSDTTLTVSIGDLVKVEPDDVTITGSGTDSDKLRLKLYKDLVLTEGVVVLDSQGRLVVRDLVTVVGKDNGLNRKINLGQMNFTKLINSGLAVNYSDDEYSTHYVLSFNFNSVPTKLQSATFTLSRINGGEHIEPLGWVDNSGMFHSAIEGATVGYNNDSTIIEVTDFQALRNSEVYLLIKHWDESRLYRDEYEYEFHSSVTQPQYDSGRWQIVYTVDMSDVDYPDAVQGYQLAGQVFEFDVYG